MNQNSINCPSCGGDEICSGHLSQSDDWVNFMPDGLKKFAVTLKPNGVRIENRSHMCRFCGFLWTKADPEKLKETLKIWAKKQKG